MMNELSKDELPQAPMRWGILGAAQIARKNWKAVWNSGNSVVSAVASREVSKSRAFIQECQKQAPFENPVAALGSYEELIASRKVDAVYIPLPTGLRKEWVMKAAAAGKHVLSEKPCATSVADLEEMIEACERQGVQYMDGVMFMHSRRLDLLREALMEEGPVGSIRRIASQFSFLGAEEFMSDNIRLHSALEPFGCLGDLGWYNIRFTLFVMNWALPLRVSARMIRSHWRPGSPESVPVEFSAEMAFDCGATASFYCSFRSEDQQWANISGTNGFVQVDDFVLPYFGSSIGFRSSHANYRVAGCDFNMEKNERHYAVPEYSNSNENAQESAMMRNFARQAQSGQLNREWPEIALKTQRVMEACMKSARENGREISLEG